MSIWKKFRHRLEWFGLSALSLLIPLLPRRVVHLLGKVLGGLAFLVDKRGRTRALENLALVFDGTKSETEIKRIALESYHSFARTVVDQFWSPRLSRENFETFIELQYEDPETLEAARETGAIWVTPHYSNFEWIALVMGFQDYRFTIVAQDFRNPSLTAIYRKNREISGHEVIPQRGAIMRLLKNLKRGGHAAFLTDLTIKPSKPATVIKCFERETCVTAIHAELMKRTGLPVIPGICVPKTDGNYVLQIFKPLRFGPDHTEQSIAQACWDVFEPIIRENPAPWLWMYRHWRFLPAETKGTVTYPSYASRDEKFEEVRERLKQATPAKGKRA